MSVTSPGPCATSDISIEFKIRSKFECYSLKLAQLITKKCCTCQNSYTVVTCKILLWSVEYILNQNTSNFGLIPNSIEISLVGRRQMWVTSSCHSDQDGWKMQSPLIPWQFSNVRTGELECWTERMCWNILLTYPCDWSLVCLIFSLTIFRG